MRWLMRWLMRWPVRWPVRWLWAAIVLVALVWGAGFGLFVLRAARPAGPAPQADGIVVLTGGAGRIETALALLAQHRARLMLISGVEPRLELNDLLRAGRLRLPDPALASRIALGHAATTTLGNAAETADWFHANKLHSLIVVTAGYHMQRALALIGSALPQTPLLPYPVQPPAMLRLASLGTLRLLAAEYNKWLLVLCGLSGPGPRKEVA